MHQTEMKPITEKKMKRRLYAFSLWEDQAVMFSFYLYEAKSESNPYCIVLIMKDKYNSIESEYTKYFSSQMEAKENYLALVAPLIDAKAPYYASFDGYKLIERG